MSSTDASSSADRPTLASRRIPIVVVIALTLLSAIAHGVLDGRWSEAEDLREIGARLEDLPDQFGDWVLVDDKALDDNVQQLLRCYGSANRVYRNQKTKNTISVAVLFGPRGPIAVHRPEICYDSVGTEQVGPTRKDAIRTASANHEFWKVQFAQEPLRDSLIEVWYGWTTDGKWQAAEHPRFWLTESLYKLQLAGPAGHEGYQPCRDFLEDFLPHVDRILRPSATL